MIVSKKEFNELKKQVNEQDNLINNMIQHIVQLEQKINELQRPKEPKYFG